VIITFIFKLDMTSLQIIMKVSDRANAAGLLGEGGQAGKREIPMRARA